MTYRELKEALEQLSPMQLDMEVAIHDNAFDEFYPVARFYDGKPFVYEGQEFIESHPFFGFDWNRLKCDSFRSPRSQGPKIQ